MSTFATKKDLFDEFEGFSAAKWALLKKNTKFCVFFRSQMSKKKWKMAEKMKISGGNWRKNCEQIVLSLRMISSFLCHTTQGNHEKWRKTSFCLGCMKHYFKNCVIQPKTECCHYMQISKQKMWEKNKKFVFTNEIGRLFLKKHRFCN